MTVLLLATIDSTSGSCGSRRLPWYPITVLYKVGHFKTGLCYKPTVRCCLGHRHKHPSCSMPLDNKKSCLQAAESTEAQSMHDVQNLDSKAGVTCMLGAFLRGAGDLACGYTDRPK